MKRQSGITLVEVLVASAIIGIAAILVVPQINTMRKVTGNTGDIELCRAQIQRGFNLLESGGMYTLAQPVFTAFEDSNLDYNSRPRPFRVPLGERVSFIPGNNRTFQDRFNQFVGHTDLYRLRGANVGDYRRVSRNTSAGPKDTEALPTDNDGIISYLPLLSKGAVSDLADLYINSQYRHTFGAAPSYLSPSISLPHVASSTFQLKIDRIERESGLVNPTNDKFWPIPVRGLALAKSPKDNIIRDPDHALRMALLLKDGINNGQGMRLVTFPYGPSGALYMSNRFGFRAHIKHKLTLQSGESIECQSAKDYHLPSDQQLIGKPNLDFNFLKSDGQNYDSQILSDKFYPLASGGGVDKAAALKFCSGNCSSSQQMVISEPKWLAIITNTNFGKSATDGKAMAKNGVDRPVCSQDNTETKTFTFILRFSNLGKDGASIPLCLDKSYKPSALQQADIYDSAYASQRSIFKWGPSSQKDSYIWCEGGDSSLDVATGARTLIMNDMLPTQGGYVPCEQLRICGQAPNKVTVKSLGGQAVEYQYEYQVRNSDNRTEKNRLWGCVPQFSAAVTDVVGNLMYLESLPFQPSTELTQELLNQEYLVGQGLIKTISPNIYFKPPPCYGCECKKCKKKKKWFTVLVGAAFFFAGGFMAAGLLGSVSASVATAAAASAGIAAVTGVGFAIGVIAMTAMSVCGFQMMGLTNGGSCSSNERIADFNKFQSCKKDPKDVCKCGANCNKISPPTVVFEDGTNKDLPPGITDKSIYGYCGYEREDNRTNTATGIVWNVRKGARINPPNTYIDERAIVNHNNPSAELIEGVNYTPVNDVSEFFYINKKDGFACYSADECYFDDADERPKWRIKQDIDYDQTGNTDQKVEISACGRFKVGYALTGSANPAEKNVVRLASPTTPSCIAPDIGNNLWGCEGSGIGNELKTRCYLANGELKMSDLIDPPNELGGAVYAGKPTGAPAVSFKVSVATDNNTNIIDKSYTFVEYRDPKCQSVNIPAVPIPVSRPHGIDTAPTPGNVYNVDFSSYNVHEKCPSSTLNNSIECDFTCSLSGTSCTGSPSDAGTCVYNAPIPAVPSSCTPINGASCNSSCARTNLIGSCIYSAGSAYVPPSCSAYPGYCKQRIVYHFEYWYGCEMPKDIEAHTLSFSNRGMVCYQDNYTSTHSGLPLCGGGASTGSDDYVDAVGNCTKKGGGTCVQPDNSSLPAAGGGGFDGGY